MKSFKTYLKEMNDKSSYDMHRGKGKMQWKVSYETATHSGYETIVLTDPKGDKNAAKRALLTREKSNVFNIKVIKKLGILK